MKRGTFIFIFIIFLLIFSGSFLHTNNQIATLGCGGGTSNSGDSENSNSNSNSDCFFKNRNPPSDNVLTFVSPPEVIAVAATMSSMGLNIQNIPVGFKLHVPAANPSFAIREGGGASPSLSRTIIANTESECSLYTFTERIRFSGTYTSEFDHKETDPISGKSICYYLGIAGELIDGFNDCPEFPRGVPTESCPPSHQCSYSFDKTYTYGYIVVGDKPGCNPIVTPIQQYDSQAMIVQALNAAADLCRGVESSSQNKCGDGKVDEGEECDDGNNNGDNRRCTSSCKRNICGDGKILSDPIDMVNGRTEPPNSDYDKRERIYEECDDGNLIDRDGCSKDCRNENLCDTSTEFACYTQYNIDGERVRGGAGWCCDKWVGDCIPQDCSLERGNCSVGFIKQESILTKDYGIKWLNTNQPFPEECSCSESTLFIIGDVISSGQGSARELFGGYALSRYCEMKKRYGDECTFALHVSDWPDFVEKIANLALRSNHNLKRFKNLYVFTHGLPQGTAISEYGDTYGALLCNGGKADMISCLVGTKPFLGILGAPRLVQEFCNMAPVNSQIRVSESVILVSARDMNPYWDLIVRQYGVCDLNNPDCGIYQTAGDFHCHECTGVGTSREIACTGFS